MSYSLFGGPYYYFCRDKKNINKFTELITISIMGNSSMTDFKVEQRHHVNGARTKTDNIATQTLDRAMGEMSRLTEHLTAHGYEHVMDTQDPNFF